MVGSVFPHGGGGWCWAGGGTGPRGPGRERGRGVFPALPPDTVDIGPCVPGQLFGCDLPKALVVLAEVVAMHWQASLVVMRRAEAAAADVGACVAHYVLADHVGYDAAATAVVVACQEEGRWWCWVRVSRTLQPGACLTH